jgi:hypothetical protein
LTTKEQIFQEAFNLPLIILFLSLFGKVCEMTVRPIHELAWKQHPCDYSSGNDAPTKQGNEGKGGSEHPLNIYFVSQMSRHGGALRILS